MDFEQALFARADELMTNAPGRVNVRRVSHIDDVKIVREARAALSEDHKAQLIQLRLQMMERLDGALAVWTPPPIDKKGGLFGALLSPLLAIAKGLSTDMRARGEFDHMVHEAGGRTRLPAPDELIDAAELWAISHLVGDAIQGDVAVLRRSWDEATIDPV